MKSVLDKIIYEDQKGFVAGRFIGENQRYIYDILYETKTRNVPGLLLSVDFEKAFDSVSWDIIHTALDYFGFGPSIRHWVETFYTGTESSILQNGHMSSCFQTGRGCRQGDPLSPYLFLLCAEILGLMIRQNQEIKGIQINGKTHLLSQYADDTQLFLDGSEESLRATLGVFEQFYLMSGLKMNFEKTKAIWIGSEADSNTKLCTQYDLDWSGGKFVILGITFNPHLYNIWNINYSDKLNQVKSLLRAWSKRKLTLLGRVTIIKSLAISKLVHLFLALPTPPDEVIKELNQIFFQICVGGKA